MTGLSTAKDVVAIQELLEEQRNFNKTLLEFLHQQEIRIQQMEIQNSQVAATTEKHLKQTRIEWPSYLKDIRKKSEAK